MILHTFSFRLTAVLMAPTWVYSLGVEATARIHVVSTKTFLWFEKAKTHLCLELYGLFVHACGEAVLHLAHLETTK